MDERVADREVEHLGIVSGDVVLEVGPGLGILTERVLASADDEILLWKKVKVALRKEDLPGKPERIVNCVRCGEKVFDGKDVVEPDKGEGPLCRACAYGSYYDV